MCSLLGSVSLRAVNNCAKKIIGKVDCFPVRQTMPMLIQGDIERALWAHKRLIFNVYTSVRLLGQKFCYVSWNWPGFGRSGFTPFPQSLPHYIQSIMCTTPDWFTGTDNEKYVGFYKFVGFLTTRRTSSHLPGHARGSWSNPVSRKHMKVMICYHSKHFSGFTRIFLGKPVFAWRSSPHCRLRGEIGALKLYGKFA